MVVTEVYAILRAVKLLNERGESGRSYTIFSDPQAAVARVQHTDCDPARALAKAVVDFFYELRDRDNSITIRWTPPTRESRGTSRQTLGPREQLGKRRSWQALSIYERPPLPP